MKIKTAQFITSSPNLKLCPETTIPEIALIGRSNVGKSSFINTLANRKSLAKTSNTPGKTRLINLFNFDDTFMIADLPGYGWAKISKSEQLLWQKNLEEYLLQREQLKAVFHFIDSRHPIQENDFEMREWLNFHNINVITICSKADYIGRNKINAKIQEIKKAFGGEVIAFSSKDKIYKDSVLKIIEETLNI